MSRTLPLAATLLLAVTPELASCAAVGPEHVVPDVDVPAAWAGRPDAATSAGSRGAGSTAAWWSRFGDPLLDALLERALASSLDLEVASARVREARALRAGTAAGRTPRLDLEAGAARVRASENGPVDLGTLSDAGLAEVETSLFQGGFDASWEIDLFGAVRRRVERADAGLAAVEAELEDARRIVAAEVARTYVELRGAQSRLELAERNVRIQADTLELVTNRRSTGLARPLDVHRARAQLATTESSRHALQAAVDSAAFRLGVLAGEPPAGLLEELRAPGPIPIHEGTIPVGLPAELLAARPDVRAAERRLAQAAADVGVATADLYPRLLLGAGLGLSSSSLDRLARAGSSFFSIGPSLRWPVFQGGELRARVSASEARLDAARAAFRGTVLVALEDVERALALHASATREREDLRTAVDSASRAAEAARDLYRTGLADFLEVLEAERDQRELEDLLVRAQASVATQVIAAYKALGGGWPRGADA